MVESDKRKMIHDVIEHLIDKVDFTVIVSFENGQICYIMFDPEVRHYEKKTDETP